VPTQEAQSHAANAATQQRSTHATPQQRRSGRLAIARLPPCSPGCRPDLPCYRRRLPARRAGLPPRPARTPAAKSPADAQLPPPPTASSPKAWTAATQPALVDAALRKRAAPRACIRGTSPALVVAALRERAASRACIQAHQPALAEAALQVRAASRACLCGTASTARGGTKDKGNKPRAQAGAPESRRANGSGASAPKGASHRKRGGARSLVPPRLKAVLRLLASWWAALRA